MSENADGLQRFFKQSPFPGAIGSRAAPETPDSLHEGGHLGYSISHAFEAVFDHPNLIAVTIVGDGESETGPLATSWHSSKFLNPITDSAILPILHLNEYKINRNWIGKRLKIQLLGIGQSFAHTSNEKVWISPSERCGQIMRQKKKALR